MYFVSLRAVEDDDDAPLSFDEEEEECEAAAAKGGGGGGSGSGTPPTPRLALLRLEGPPSAGASGSTEVSSSATSIWYTFHGGTAGALVRPLSSVCSDDAPPRVNSSGDDGA